MKMFISYSHADISHLELFKKHLATLRRNNELSVWYDKELIAGDILDIEIARNLNNSDIVVFLISVDFLSSFYCYEKELKSVIDQLENSQQRIVPIIVRDCDWHDNLINTFKCITFNDKPIAASSNPDTAWLSVIREIRKVLQSLKDLSDDKKKICAGKYSLTQDHQKFLEANDVHFHHRIKGKLSLSDIFIFPQLKKISEDLDRIQFAIDSESVLDVSTIGDRTILVGDEQSGKTALAKSLFKRYYCNGFCPVYLDCEKINKSDISKILKNLLPEQYEKLSLENLKNDYSKTLILLDNFNKIKLNEKSQGIFINKVIEYFHIVVIFTDRIARYFDSEYIRLSDYDKYEILPFGHKLKSDLVDKWNSLGREEILDIRELHTSNTITTQHLDSIVRKNILDSKPIYLLIVLQSIESAKPNDYSLTSYGHCYQYLITQNFEKSNVRAGDLDTFFNYMTELSYFIYRNKKITISSDELNNFQTEYSKKYFIKSHTNILNKLLDTGILLFKDEKYSFFYKYIYYFYIAKYLAEHIHEDDIKSIIAELCEELYIEENANILIFLTHHSKNESIIDEIYLQVSEIFGDVEVAKLDSEDTKCLQEFIDLIPEKVYEQRDVTKERKEYFEQKDRFEAIDKSSHSMKISDEKNNRKYQKGDIILNITKSLKSIELIGQILRNRFGSLTKSQLVDLGKASVDTGFRFLKFHLTFLEKLEKEILHYIEKLISENGKIKDEDVIKEAKKIFLALNYGISYGIIKKISMSIGSEAIISLLDELSEQYSNSPAFRVMAVAVKLDFTTVIPKKDIENVFKDLQTVPIARRLLRDIIIQHAHLHHTDYRDKQWIKNIIDIPMNSQRLIDLKVH